MNQDFNTMRSENLDVFAAALCRVQRSVKIAKKTKHNKIFHSNYADLQDVWEACQDALFENNFAVTQTLQKMGDDIYVVCTLIHSSGQWMKSNLPLILPGRDEVTKDKGAKRLNIQALGAAITYAKRYNLASLIGIYTGEIDDDGNSISENDQSQETASIPEMPVIEENIDSKHVEILKSGIMADRNPDQFLKFMQSKMGLTMSNLYDTSVTNYNILLKQLDNRKPKPKAEAV